ncbi:MAG: glutamate synthase large subunit, partial [Abditibacteriaceae bacterium]
MGFSNVPQKQGLYDPANEHDACGMGFVTDLHGRKSHRIVDGALEILVNLEHRGASGAEVCTGDGAGILTQIPHSFFKSTFGDLPEIGDYGVGMLYLPSDTNTRNLCQKRIEEIVTEENQTLLGWREVPTNNSSLGETSKSVEPSVFQLFIGKNENIERGLNFERKLYVIRKRLETELGHVSESTFQSGNESSSDDSTLALMLERPLYICSLSSRTIVYKGMLTPEQVGEYYPDLAHPNFETAIALVHSRFSTNTFPSWERAHPYRYVIHNGEINTLRGNINWMHAREKLLQSDLFGDDLSKVFPVVDASGSDSAMFDNVLEFLTLGGYSLPHAVMMMIPEPWAGHAEMDDAKLAFYEYHACLMEPWDGPASIGFTDGTVVGAVLDRNGLRPSRYYVTKDGLVILASEVGVLDVPPADVLEKGRLQPGRMFLVDTAAGRIISDEEIKREIATAKPYRRWLNDNLRELEDLPHTPEAPAEDHHSVLTRQLAFGYTYEDLNVIVGPMGKMGVQPIGSMGNDAPLGVLSNKPQLLYNYFKQLFAQVTNPPIDSIREELITSTWTTLGKESNLLNPIAESCAHIGLQYPIISNEELARLRQLDTSVTLPILYDATGNGAGLEAALKVLFAGAESAIEKGASILILSDKGVNEKYAPVPALLAISGLHHHLIKNGTRTKVGLVLESGEPREVHHFSVLMGYGAGAINPYLTFESLDDMIVTGLLTDVDSATAVKKFIKASVKGIVKTMSKMGISTIQSYRGAQIFEAVGIHPELIEKYFCWTSSRIGGIKMEEIALEARKRHERAFPPRGVQVDDVLDEGGVYQWKRHGEHHGYNPLTIHKLQNACRTNNYDVFKEYSALLDDEDLKHRTLRGLMELQFDTPPVPLEEVESVEQIVKRFKTGAMSYGSISQETHEALAIAMNRLGGKSNTGEGGEDPARFTPDANGDSRCSKIKQVASARFGVTSEYLTNAVEIQIKMAQGAKPGEGGELPGKKVYPWIAKVRGATPGVGLISPPPHHDIYSIEDLKQLIHDLKNANPGARISVKLVSEVGVGTIAAGVAKAKADVVLISGYEGGTGASPQSSIWNAGLPWELGLAETHQTLLLNNLRSRIAVETDGKLMTGRDVIVAALLGAEEFGFATAPLVVLGCIMMRVCHLNTCPVGIATQDPQLRKLFAGDPDHVVNFMRFIAQEMRELMAQLGYRTVNEMVGHVDRLKAKTDVQHWQAKGVDISALLHQPQVPEGTGTYCSTTQDHGLDASLDRRVLLDVCAPALEKRERVEFSTPIRNTNRVVGTILGHEVTKRYGAEGLPDDTINLHFTGSAGQSFGAFVPRGITMHLEGDANDYLGKGLSGGKIIVVPPRESTFVPRENIIIGNVALYGATSGEVYIRGMAGERFAVRNSGVTAVVEAVGDHGCEYMTGGYVVVLGTTGRNFAAGMSGGVAYVLDEKNQLAANLNGEMVDIEALDDVEEVLLVRDLIQKHKNYTDSAVAHELLENWEDTVRHFKRVMPRDYKRAQEAMKRAKDKGLSGEEA